MGIEIDTSNYAIEGVLSMECENKQWKLIAHLSKSLNKVERNYKIYNKEMLVVIKVQKLNKRQA